MPSATSDANEGRPAQHLLVTSIARLEHDGTTVLSSGDLRRLHRCTCSGLYPCSPMIESMLAADRYDRFPSRPDFACVWAGQGPGDHRWFA